MYTTHPGIRFLNCEFKGTVAPDENGLKVVLTLYNPMPSVFFLIVQSAIFLLSSGYNLPGKILYSESTKIREYRKFQNA
jgi:hypothetical protein